NAKLHDASSVVGKIAASKMPVEQWLEDAYLAALGRLPSAAEKAAVSRALADAKDDQRPVMEDVFWALMSNREFIFNH
ncbi:MAG: S-layer protein, partial [Verrucomicrobiota bacterium]